jgi:exosortase H (IPTLxxWG-CTERM-specific)
MIGSPIARAAEAPGGGYHWGAKAWHPELPRGERVNIGRSGPMSAVLFGLELTPPVQEWFVVPWTNTLARVSAGLVTLFDPDVVSTGKVLRSTSNAFAVSIEAGCNGVEATLVLLAAMLAFPSSWSRKAIGLVAGIAAVQGLNIVRVISLFYLGQWNREVFEWAHLYVWQALIMLDVLIVWLLWVRTLPRAGEEPPGPPPAGAVASA